jgi:hypothetical protein
VLAFVRVSGKAVSRVLMEAETTNHEKRIFPAPVEASAHESRRLYESLFGLSPKSLRGVDDLLPIKICILKQDVLAPIK